MHACWTSGDAPQDIAWGFDMSVENETRPQGPSKVSRRNLIAGAAVAVPAAAVLNASSAWAKPVVNSLIGMPALVASKQYQFTELFSVVGSPSVSYDKHLITVSGLVLKNRSGESLTVGVAASASRSGDTGFKVSVTPSSFSRANTDTQTLSLGITTASPPPNLSHGVYSITLTLSVTGTSKAVTYFFEVSA